MEAGREVVEFLEIGWNGIREASYKKDEKCLNRD